MYLDGIKFKLSTRAEKKQMPSDLYQLLLSHFRARDPMLELHSLIALAPSATSKVLLPHAHFFDHVVVNNHRYMASSRATQARLADALIAVRISNNGAVWVGELQDIFLVNQPAVGVHYFGRVRWLKPVEFDISNTLWHQL